MILSDSGSTSTLTRRVSLLRFLLTASTGTTTSWSVAPPWTNREPPPASSQPVDRLGDLHLDVAVESELRRVERGEGVVDLEAVPEDVAAVDDQDVVALRLRRQEERVGQRLVLEQEAVVGGDEDVGGVGVRDLLHQVDDVAQRVLDGLEDLSLGARLVAGGVDAVVVDVQDPVGLEELATLLGAEGLEVLGLDRRAADASQGSCGGGRCRWSAGRRRARSCASAECLRVRVRQQCRHAELRVARQHPEDGLEVGVEAVLLADAGAKLVGHLVAQGVGDDDDGLLVAVADQRLDVVARRTNVCERSAVERHVVDLRRPAAARRCRARRRTCWCSASRPARAAGRAGAGPRTVRRA